MSDIANKPLKNAGLTQLINNIKTNLIHRADVTTTTFIDVDSTPTASSTNLVTSGGVKTALDTKVSDVKIGGTTIVTSGVANIPINSNYGISKSVDNELSICCATETEIDNRNDDLQPSYSFRDYQPIVCGNLNYAVRSVKPNVELALPESSERLTANQIYNLEVVATPIEIKLPTTGEVGDFIQVDFLATSAVALTITASYSAPVTDHDALTTSANHIYSLFFDYGAIQLNEGVLVYGWRYNYAEYEYTPNV